MSAARVDFDRDLSFLSTSPAINNSRCLRPRGESIHHTVKHRRQPSFDSWSSGSGKQHFIFSFWPARVGECPPSTLTFNHQLKPPASTSPPSRSIPPTSPYLPNRPPHTYPALRPFSLPVVCQDQPGAAFLWQARFPSPRDPRSRRAEIVILVCFAHLEQATAHLARHLSVCIASSF